MPIERGIPKSGFRSRQALYRMEVLLSELNKIEGDIVDLSTLKQFGLVRANTKDVKIIASGEIHKALTIRGIPLSAGARKAVEAAHGKVE